MDAHALDTPGGRREAVATHGAQPGAFRRLLRRCLPGARTAQAGREARERATLARCFDILQRQLTAAEAASAQAVAEMTHRLVAVQTRCDQLRADMDQAVSRAGRLASQAEAQTVRQQQALNTLSEHGLRYEAAQSRHRDELTALIGQVTQLTPLASQIGQIARHTNLLALNAAVEAARAGQSGAGFKIVAGEVRELSNQTADAARQMSEGFAALSASGTQVGRDTGHAPESQALQAVAEQIAEMGRTPGEVATQLRDLSQAMDRSTQAVRHDILEALGQMQFQDINRQLLTQVGEGLAQVARHLGQACVPDDPDAADADSLDAMLARWESAYVMHEQRVSHARAHGDEAPADAAPKIELF